MALESLALSAFEKLAGVASNWISSRIQHEHALLLERAKYQFSLELESKKQDLQLLQLQTMTLLHRDTQRFQLERDALEQERRERLQAYIQTVELKKQERSFDFQRWQLEEQKRLQRETEQSRRELQFELAHLERQTRFASAEFQKILENFPLLISPSQIVEGYRLLRAQGRPLPLLILVNPPDVAGDGVPRADGVPRLGLRLGEGLRRLYGNSSENRVKLLDGGWKSKRFHGGAAAEMLFSALREIPTVLLESEIDGPHLRFHVYFWTVGQAQYTHQPILSNFPYKEFLNDSARARAQAWMQERATYVEGGMSPEQLRAQGGTDEDNLKVLEAEQADQAMGRKRSRDYQISELDLEDLCQHLVAWHRLSAGWLADVYHLITYESEPLLPRLLAESDASTCGPMAMDRRGVDSPMSVDAVGRSYEAILNQLADSGSPLVPDLSLRIAKGLAVLQDKSCAGSQVEYAMAKWAELRGSTGGGSPLDEIVKTARGADQDFLRLLRDCLGLIGRNREAARISSVLEQQGRQALESTDDDRGPMFKWP